jgi:23S rRNA pseudouridine1911/1915/1917 synthase
MGGNVHVIEHTGEEARLDKILVEHLGTTLMCSRSQVERWIEDGAVSVDGKVIVKPAFKVGDGARIEVVAPSEAPTHLRPFDFPLEVLFEDAHLVVLNKPAGISMHPGAGNDTHTIANAVVHHVGKKQLSVGESDRPGIVHRLDKDTTGVVVIAKSTPVHAALARQFAERDVGRAYYALVYSTPRAVRAIQTSDEGEVSAPIGRHPTNRKIMTISDQGRPATTLWRVVERFPHGTLLECTLKTGRTHQIRVHMNSIGSPVIGDPVYGDFSNLPKPLRDSAALLGRQALHAATLSFTHPITKERLSFSAPLPEDFQRLLAAFRGTR